MEERIPRSADPGRLFGFATLDAPLDSSGTGRGEERAPVALRRAGLLESLGAGDAGGTESRIRDTRRDPDTGVIGAAEIRRAASAIGSRVSEVLAAGGRPLVIGGDCALLLGVFQALAPGSGMWFVDGHADFFDGTSSPTGEAADMDLAILTGHGPPGLLESDRRLLDPEATILRGHRPGWLHADVARENARLDPAIDAMTAPEVRRRGAERVGSEAAARLARRPAWLHLDLDVLDGAEMPAVSYPQPSGLSWDELAGLLQPLFSTPNLLGVSVADFNPDLDPGGTYADRVVATLAALCGDQPHRAQ